MADEQQPNFDKIFEDAQQTAAEQDTRANELLWGHVVSRAAVDEAFRKDLQQNPEQAVKREADTLKITVHPEQLKQVRQLFSPVLPGSDPKKVEELVFSTIEDIRKSFTTTMTLSKALFWTGLAMLVAALVFAALQKASPSWLFGSGGVISLIVSLIMNPLDRIRNAGANLVQIQMAYLAYYNLMYLLGTRRERVSVEDASHYAKELRDSASSMVGTIQTILDKAPRYQMPPLSAKGHTSDSATGKTSGSREQTRDNAPKTKKTKQSPKERTNSPETAKLKKNP